MHINTVALTGHRPKKLWGYNLSEPHYQAVANALLQFCKENNVQNIVSGMALGFDQLGAIIAIENNIRLIAAIPFAGQEKQWPATSQKAYHDILRRSSKQHIVCEGAYAAWKMQARNEWMVDQADTILALWDSSSGGTANCVNYAHKQGKPVFRLNPKFVSLTAENRFA